jgi:hypothetical protein
MLQNFTATLVEPCALTAATRSHLNFTPTPVFPRNLARTSEEKKIQKKNTAGCRKRVAPAVFSFPLLLAFASSIHNKQQQ